MQGGPEPQAQLPLLRQRSLKTGSQTAQLRPSTPHDVIELERQLKPSQQPSGHDDALHTQVPLLQRWPTAHCGPVPH
jgi:hypothetical protein